METYLKQGSEAWKVWRRSKITATDSTIITGMSPYKTIEQLYNEKTKGFEQTPNSYMLRGSELEPIALEKFEEETGHVLFPRVMEHRSISWMIASMDGVSVDRKVAVEIKCNGKKNHAIAKKGKPVDFHFCQLQHQMEVCDLQKMYYYSFDGEKGVIIEVKRDQEFIDIMLAKELEFWHSIQIYTLPKS